MKKKQYSNKAYLKLADAIMHPEAEAKALAIVEAQYEITETLNFADGVSIEVQNDSVRFAWRLRVGAAVSHWTTHYQGILSFEGWFVATAYWKGVFPEMVPFKVQPIKLIDSSSSSSVADDKAQDYPYP